MNRLTACAVALLMAFSAFAQTKIDVQAPNLVGLEEQFNVTFVIEGSAPSDFSWDAGDDFQLVWGPQKGSVSTYSNTNGHSSRSSKTTYTYILLPKAIGKFSLPAAHATVKGADIQSDPWGIEVVADSGRQSRQESQSGNSAAVTGSVSSDDIYLSFDLSKSDVVVGETVTATLKLYQRVNLVGFENVKFPTFNGFWSQETQAPTNLEFHRESVDGKIYNVALIRSWTLVPQQAGDIVIDPTEMVSVINIRVDRPSSGSIFDEFFQNDYQSIRKRLTTEPVTVRVNRLPDGDSAGFKSFHPVLQIQKSCILCHICKINHPDFQPQMLICSQFNFFYVICVLYHIVIAVIIRQEEHWLEIDTVIEILYATSFPILIFRFYFIIVLNSQQGIELIHHRCFTFGLVRSSLLLLFSISTFRRIGQLFLSVTQVTSLVVVLFSTGHVTHFTFTFTTSKQSSLKIRVYGQHCIKIGYSFAILSNFGIQ